MRTALAVICSQLALCLAVAAAQEADLLATWRRAVRIEPVARIKAETSENARHTIHSYFNACPESPDGKWILYYTSTEADAGRGEVRVRSRSTGEERVLAGELAVEDAHRAACQQWVSNGKTVVYHAEGPEGWYVAAVDVETGRHRVLAKDRLSCWGRPESDLVPLYGLHWNADGCRDLEIVNASTREVKTVLAAEAVKQAYPAWVQSTFGEKPISIFFPELSPDLKRVFFKMASPGNGNPRSGGASRREGLVCYDLQERRFLLQRQNWGHPAWHPDSRHILDVGYASLDTETNTASRAEGLPPMGSGHPSLSPDGKLIVTDLTADRLGGSKDEWAIVVCDARGGSHAVIHRFDNSHGAKSWRRSHPHPVFSADGRRIYFNVNSDRWTELWVAECGAAALRADQ